MPIRSHLRSGRKVHRHFGYHFQLEGSVFGLYHLGRLGNEPIENRVRDM